MLDAVSDYLPDPSLKENKGFLINDDKTENEIVLLPEEKLPFVGYAFKLEENKFG